MKKWFAAQKQQTKIMLWYTIFALLPMIFITLYTYFFTRQLMLDNLNKNLDSQIEQIAWDLEDTTGDYYTISNMLYMDETLWSYLKADYSERGYEDLYLYVDQLFSNIRMLYPEKFRKLANHYYGSNKAWISGRFLEKLENLNRQEERKNVFVKMLEK